MKINYKQTISACFIGYIIQAIVNNFVPLLFVTFQKSYSIELSKITVLITINFVIQLCIDLASAYFIDKIGYRASALIAHGCSAAGLILLTILPERICGHSDFRYHICNRRRLARGSFKPDNRSLPHGKQRKGHEPFAFVLLLGAHGRCAAFHRVFCNFRHRKLESTCFDLGCRARF